jgi:mRNA (guanine-N7-)-methyltransferase
LGRCTFTCADLGSDVPGRIRSSSSSSSSAAAAASGARRRVPRMQKLLTWSLQDEPPRATTTDPPEFRAVRGGGISPTDRFDVVSIQFAIHYMMSTR